VSFLRDTTILQVSAAARAVTSLAGALMLTHLLGARGQGHYYVAGALFSLLWLLVGTGAPTVTVARIAAAAGDRAGVLRWQAFFAKANLLTSLAVGILGSALAPLLSSLLDVPREVGLWGAALSWTPLLEMPRALVAVGLQGVRRMRALALLETSCEVVRVFLIAIGALLTGGPEGAIGGWVVASALSSVLAPTLLARERAAGVRLPSLGEVARAAPGAPLLEGMRQGLAVGIARNAGALGREVAPGLLVAAYGRAETVAYLRIALRVASAAHLLGSGVSRTALPALGAAVGDVRRLRRNWGRATLLGIAYVSAAWVVALALLPTVLEHLTPRDYHRPVALLCWLLTPSVLLLSSGTVSEAFHVVTHTVGDSLRLATVGLLIAMAIMWAAIVIDPEFGAGWGLSIASAWMLAHLVYAWRWLARRQAAVACPVRRNSSARSAGSGGLKR